MRLDVAARVAAWAREGQLDALAALEALADPRLAGAEGLPSERLLREAAALVPAGDPATLATELAAAGAVAGAGAGGAVLQLPDAVAAAARPALAAVALARPVPWSPEPLTQGDMLARFAAYCTGEIDDVDVLEAAPGAVHLAWRDERACAETRIGTLFAERLEGGPWLLLAPADPGTIERFLDSRDLRARLTVWDLAELTKLVAVRSSIAVHLEWFLRDAYRRKVLPAQAFTEGLLARGIISLGM